MDDYGARIRRAWRDWHAAHDPETLSWSEVTRRCAVLLKKPETSVAVLKWKEGQQEPTLAEFRALGQVLGADPRTLAFGDAPQSAQDAPQGTEPRPAKQEEPQPANRPTATDKRAKLRRRKSG